MITEISANGIIERYLSDSTKPVTAARQHASVVFILILAETRTLKLFGYNVIKYFEKPHLRCFT